MKEIKAWEDKSGRIHTNKYDCRLADATIDLDYALRQLDSGMPTDVRGYLVRLGMNRPTGLANLFNENEKVLSQIEIDRQNRA